jgi:hypothetical protein
VSDETAETTRPREDSSATAEVTTDGFGSDGDYRRARALFAALERDGRLDGVVRRSKRLAGAGLVVALVAYDLSPGGLSGAILDVWGLVAFAVAVLGVLVWLAASAFRNGELDAPDGGATVDLETVGAPVLVSLADRTHTSAGTRLLWSLLLGEATLPAASAVAAGTDTVDDAEVRRLRRSLERAAQASVVVVAVDLALRFVGVEAVAGLFSGGEVPSLPSPAGLADLLALSPAAWLAVFVAVLVGGGLVGLALAVAFKSRPPGEGND